MMWILLACGEGKGPAVDSDTAEAGPTWEEVSPIVQRNCVSCHQPGGVGRGDFTTWEEAGPMAPVMAAYLESELMPPPAMDPGCRPYVGHEGMVLSDADRAQLIAWAQGGALQGNAVEPLQARAGTLEGAEVYALLPVAHSVSPSSDGNEYHCQVLENPFTETTYITGFDVVVDAAEVVHHTVLAIDRSGDAGGGEDDGEGWDCASPIVEWDWDMLHAWAPGMEATAFDEGLGMRVEPGDQLVLQMHYFGESTDLGTLDQSGYRFRTAESVDKEVRMAPLGPVGFTLEAGEVSTQTDSITNRYGIDVNVYGVFPHLHSLGAGYAASLESDDGSTECLAEADAWDFGNQATYLYEEPAVWRNGQTLHTSCTFDNTAENPNQYNDPVQDVTYGEGSDQEMCFFLFYYGL